MKYLIVMLALVAATSQAADVMLTSYNHCTLDKDVSRQSMKELKFCIGDKLLKRGVNNYTLYLVIESRGGEIDAGMHFINFASQISNLETVTIYAGSMAAAIVQGLPGKRHILAGGTMFFHQPSIVVRGNVSKIPGQVQSFSSTSWYFNLMNATRIGIPLYVYEQKIRHDWEVYSHDNVIQGTADRVSTVECSKKLISQRTTHQVRSPVGLISYVLSACPLMN